VIVGVLVMVGVGLMVRVGVRVREGHRVRVGVRVRVFVGVFVIVGVDVIVGVRVIVGVLLGVTGVSVGEGVTGVLVFVGPVGGGGMPNTRATRNCSSRPLRLAWSVMCGQKLLRIGMISGCSKVRATVTRTMPNSGFPASSAG
jgi:hypothetical protein